MNNPNRSPSKPVLQKRREAAQEAKHKARQDAARFKWQHPGYLPLAEVIARSDKRVRSANTHPGKRR